MLQRYSVRLQIYSWFMKYCHPNWRLRASLLFPGSDVGRRQHPIKLLDYGGGGSGASGTSSSVDDVAQPQAVALVLPPTKRTWGWWRPTMKR